MRRREPLPAMVAALLCGVACALLLLQAGLPAHTRDERAELMALPAGFHVLKPGQKLPDGARLVRAGRTGAGATGALEVWKDSKLYAELFGGRAGAGSMRQELRMMLNETVGEGGGNDTAAAEGGNATAAAEGGDATASGEAAAEGGGEAASGEAAAEGGEEAASGEAAAEGGEEAASGEEEAAEEGDKCRDSERLLAALPFPRAYRD